MINKHLNRVAKIFRKDTIFLFSPSLLSSTFLGIKVSISHLWYVSSRQLSYLYPKKRKEKLAGIAVLSLGA